MHFQWSSISGYVEQSQIEYYAISWGLIRFALNIHIVIQSECMCVLEMLQFIFPSGDEYDMAKAFIQAIQFLS